MRPIKGRFYGYRAIGSELRFKTSAKFFDITFESVKESAAIYLFFGDYMDKKYIMPSNQTITLHIEINEKFLKYSSALPKSSFSPKVIRFVIGYSEYIKFKGINTFGHEIMSPNSNKIPNKTLLIYGSSISHGGQALDYIDSYAFLLSRLLNINVLNKSIPGSCQAESIMIDYLKSIQSSATFALFGVNILNLYDINEYKEHIKYIIDNLTYNLYLTSILNNHYLLDKEEQSKLIKFRDIAKNIGFANYIEPSNLVDMTSLTTDLLHPSNYGQLQIALALKEIIKI